MCSAILLFLPLVALGEQFVSFDRMNLQISTDKRVYYTGDIAVYTVTFEDSNGKFIDPDLIRATYDSQFIKLNRASEGVYQHITGKFAPKDHQLGVYAEKDGFNFVQQSSTVRPVVAQQETKVKITAVQQGDLLKLRISNDALSMREIYKVRLITIGASIESVAIPSWIKVSNHVGVDLKSVNGSISPDERQTIKLIVDGQANMIVWNAFDIHGKQIDAGIQKVVS